MERVEAPERGRTDQAADAPMPGSGERAVIQSNQDRKWKRQNQVAVIDSENYKALTEPTKAQLQREFEQAALNTQREQEKARQG